MTHIWNVNFEIASNEQLRDIIDRLDGLQNVLADMLTEDEFISVCSFLTDLSNRASAVLNRRERQLIEQVELVREV